MKTLTKICFVSIKKTFNKFISILLIILLGVGFFAGIKITSPDMQLSANKYFSKSNLYDIFVASEWGITKDDIIYLNEKGYKVEGSYSFDTIIKTYDNENAVKVLSYDENATINKINLVNGKLPENNSECVIQNNNFTNTYKIGDKIIINDDDLIEKELTIVGFVTSPLYSSNEVGSTKLLSGILNYYLYIPINNFNNEYFTEAYIDLNINNNRFDDKYSSLVDNEEKKIEEIVDYLKDRRYNSEVKKAQNELEKKIEEYNNELKNAQNKINIAKRKIKNAELEIKNNETNLYNAKSTLEEEKIKSKGILVTLNENLSNYKNNLYDLNFNINNLETQKENLENLIKNGIDVEQNQYILDNLNTTFISLYKNKKDLENGISYINNQINIIETSIKETEGKINNGIKEIEIAKKELKIQKKKLNNSIDEMNKKFDEAKQKLDEAQKEIDEMEKPQWYVLDIESNIGFYQYKQDTQRITNIAKLFPLVFFIVAVLICLTTMTRMVEEERMDIGTLKSLGYTDASIMFKYILYAFISTIVGSTIGILIGYAIIPKTIFNMYSMMYNVGPFVGKFDIKYALLGTLIALFCIIIATILAVRSSLKEVPAELMRPKAPNPGKRVFLERITFIWKRLSFSRKVTVRNVFRYKKRFLMTIIGIAGCTGLIIAGFGLKDCITQMVPDQYEKIFNYQIELTFDSNINLDQINKDTETISKFNEINKILIAQKESIELINKDTTQTIQLVVPFDDITDFIKLQNRKSKEEYSLNKKIIISEKLYKLLDLNINDTLKIKTDENIYSVKIGGVTENYLYHYIYMNKSIYNSEKYNTLYIKTNEMTENEEKDFSKKLKELESVSSLKYNSATRNIFDSMMDNFGAVSSILIISAGLLAFVVLYNLSNVNISERKREIASIKVLGFYDFEVFRYITRENIILTTIGILFGILTGNILTGYIIKTCEIDIAMFDPVITFKSYIYSIIITIIFALIVDIVTYFILKKIKMIESLKSVE